VPLDHTLLYNFQPLTCTSTPSLVTHHLLNHIYWCHLANKLKHFADKRTAKMSTSGMATSSKVTIGYSRRDNGSQLYRTSNEVRSAFTETAALFVSDAQT